MKKIKFYLFLILVIPAPSIFAQAFNEGQQVVTAGYGFPNLVKTFLKTAVKNGVENGALNGASSSGNNISLDVKGIGPALIKYEYGLTKVVGVGAVIGYFNSTLTATNNYTETDYDYNTGQEVTGNYTDVLTYKYSSFSIGGRMNFHFATTDKLDPYAGIAAGYSSNNASVSYKTNNPYNGTSASVSASGIPVYFGLTIGLRGYLTDNVGFYTELGIDKASIIQAGLAFKF